MRILRTKCLVTAVAVAGFAALANGCASDSYAAQGAAKGGTTGAVAGAAGGMVTALIFGGNVGEAAARGAVYGGTTGAVVGGMSGAEADRAVEQQRQAERDAEVQKFRKEIGDDAFNGISALADCKYTVAIANAEVAQESRNRDFSLAGYWVEALTEADRGDMDAARALLPEIVTRDRDIKTDADAEQLLGEALQSLVDIRSEYDLPTECK